MTKPPLAVKNSPISFGVASTSKIKIDAVQEAVTQCNYHATVNGIHQIVSGVLEQPVGEHEMLQGAVNRALSAWEIDPRFDCYISIENGICEEEEDTWVDYAVVLTFLPTTGQMCWVHSEAVHFPSDAVRVTFQKPGGFKDNTVGKTLKEMGRVRFSDDPHLDLSPKSRREILKEAILGIFSSLK